MLSCFAVRIILVRGHCAQIVWGEQTEVLLIAFDITSVEAASIMSNLLGVIDLHVWNCVPHSSGIQIFLNMNSSLFLFIYLSLNFHSVLMVLLAHLNWSVVKLLSQIHSWVHSTISLVHYLLLRPELLWSHVHSFLSSFRRCCLRRTSL